jgi:hypothetical protein
VIPTQATPQVLYIIGEGRSGSTVLGMLLGQVEGIASVGELRFIWSRGLRDNQRCGCGSRFNDCSYWTGILRALEQTDRSPRGEDASRPIAIGSMRKFPYLFLSDRLFPGRARIRHTIALFDALYKVIGHDTGCTTILDSSKSVPFGYFLARYSRLDVRFLHMIRDSRAVAFSRQKHKLRPEIADRIEYMPTATAWRSSVKWVINNGFAPLVCHGRPYLRVLYEDFSRCPRDVLRCVFEFLDLPTTLCDTLIGDDNRARLHVLHSISGNPTRFTRGELEIKPDERWKIDMPAWKRRLVTALTWPLLNRYYQK